jgi:putative membrane protein
MITEGQMACGCGAAVRGTMAPMRGQGWHRRFAGVAAAVGAALVAAGPAAAHGPVPAARPDAASVLLGWDFEPAVILPLLAIAIWWWRVLGSIDRNHPDHPVPARQRWPFFLGLLAIAVALQSGIARYDTTLFSVHMVQHLLLTLVAPPLLALGAPITQLLRASSPRTRQRFILPALHSRVVSVIGHPLVAWIVFTAVMWGTHFSPIFNASLEDPLTHDVEHIVYLAAGLLFWWPLIGLDPAPHRMSYPARIGYVFMQMPQNSFLAMAVLFASSPLYPHYATLGSPYGIDALADQRLAAGIMWFLGDVIFLIATLAVLGAWMRNEERSAAGSERQADSELAAIREREVALRLRRAGEAAGIADASPASPADQSGPGVSRSDR